MIKISIFFVLLLGVLITGCAQTSSNDDVIRIGSIGILTGEGSAWGNAAKNGIDLAVHDINENGGINGKLLVVNHQDDGMGSAQTISAFNSLVHGSNINIIIGPTWSSRGIPLIELADSAKALMISPSLGKSEFNQGSKYLFNTWPADFIVAGGLADYVYELGHRRVGIIGAQEIWVLDQTKAFTERFVELGGTVVVVVEPLPTQMDVGSEALKIDAANIDAIISTTDGILVGARVAKRVRELGNELPIYSISIDQAAISAAEGAYEGMTFLTSLNPSAEYTARYMQRYNVDLDIGASSAYDAVMLIAKAIEETDSTDTTILADYLLSITEYEGVSGDMVADGEGRFNYPASVKIVRDGKIELFE